MDGILSNKLEKKVILLGNEAIVRGALEAGVSFVSTYPGTPASEIGNIFYRVSKDAGVYFEFSTNEKVALEAGIGASFSNLKTLVAMKSFGVNVALDSLLPLAYTGTKGPMVIIVADDPNCWSSAQSEENSRAFAYLSHIPILEPSDPQECKDFTKLGFEISEKFKIPVIIRTTTRVAHQSSLVKLEEILKPENKGEFIKDKKRFVTMPPRVLEMKGELLDKIEKIREVSEKSKINKEFSLKKSKVGIITSGVSYLYVMEALKELGLDLPVLKLGFFYPLPVKTIKIFIKKFKKVLVVEELEPYLEGEVERLAKTANCKLEVVGKALLSQIGEMKPEFVIHAIASVTGKKVKISDSKFLIPKMKHSARFCPGCPYWSVFATVKKIAPENTVFGGDIGCYMLGSVSPHNLYDYLFSMGSSVGIAHGINKSAKSKVIAFIGDSTFFHAGIPPLINTVFNKSNPLIIILDNQTTAMTGHQLNPGMGEDGIKIENIVSACGVKNLKIIDPANVKQFEDGIKEFLVKEDVSVIIARHMCALLIKKQQG